MLFCNLRGYHSVVILLLPIPLLPHTSSVPKSGKSSDREVFYLISSSKSSQVSESLYFCSILPQLLLQVAISIFLSPTAISRLFPGANGIKRDNIKIVSQQLSGRGGRGGTTASWNFLSPFQKGKMLESLIFSKVHPNRSPTTRLGAP